MAVGALGAGGGCSTSNNESPSPGSSTARDSGSGGGSTRASDGATTDASDGGSPSSDAGSVLPPGNWTFVLIDDMETTTHGPIELDAGIASPLTAGYWYNSGAQVGLDAGDAGDMSDPPYQSFVFTALPKTTTTLNGKTSAHAARQACVLTGQYDTCGVGFEFAQRPDPDAGTDATAAPGDAGDAGDGGPAIPRITVPFDISQYKAVTFWGKTTTPDETGTLQVKIQFPDTDTDPRGGVCNGGSFDYTKCYNSYATQLTFTTSWQEFVVWLDAGDGGLPPDGGIAIDPTWGFQGANWIPKQVYGVNWQTQKNTDPDAGALSTEIWIDDVYFIK